MNDNVRSGLMGVSLTLGAIFTNEWIGNIPHKFVIPGSIFFGLLVIVFMLIKSSRKEKTSWNNSQQIEQLIQGFAAEIIKKIRESEAKVPQIPPSLSKSVTAKELVTDENTNDERESISRRIKEAVEHLNKRSFVIARNLLYGILADIKGKEVFGPERARVYNNLGVSYNQPDENGDIDQAKKFFEQALTENPSLYLAKLNLGTAYIGENTEASIQKGYELVDAVWKSFNSKEEFKDEELEPLIGAIVWTTYRFKGPKLGLELIERLKGQRESVASKLLPVLSLKASMYAEIGDFKRSIETCNATLEQYPDDAETLSLSGRVLLRSTIKHGGDAQDLELLPEIEDKEAVETALIKLDSAKTLAESQNKPYLLPAIQMGIIECQLLLGQFHDATATLGDIVPSELPAELQQQSNVLQFTAYLQNREFERAFSTLNESAIYKNTSYDEKKLIAKRFLYRGAPEQAERILLELEAKANIGWI